VIYEDEFSLAISTIIMSLSGFVLYIAPAGRIGETTLRTISERLGISPADLYGILSGEKEN
jgi:hypothetical protein